MSYVINNLISGVLYDTYVNYLQEVSPGIATSFWSFYGYATFISALLMMLVPKIGYKKLLLFCSASCAVAMFSINFYQLESILYIATLLSLVGVQLHYIMLAPYISVYTDQIASDESIKWYSRAYYMGYIGYFISTYLGGLFVVKVFSQKLQVTYEVAKDYTTDIVNLPPDIKNVYLEANADVLTMIGVVAILCIVPVLLIKEDRADYQNEAVIKENAQFKFNVDELKQLVKNKKVRMYLLYWGLISFAMGLFTSYYTVFLNRNLHIDKATSSLLVAISYVAIVLFMAISPIVVKKIGRVKTLSFSVFLSIPFMLIIANGDVFGQYTIPVVGAALFIRAGLANIGSPAEGSLTMGLVSKELRPALTTCINLIAGVVSVISGLFTGNILFVNQEGYRVAYYIASGIYLVCSILMYKQFKEYNKEKGE